MTIILPALIWLKISSSGDTGTAYTSCAANLITARDKRKSPRR
jgi:hypothetical protein